MTMYRPVKELSILTLAMVKKEMAELEYIPHIERYIYVYRPKTQSFHIYNSKTWKETICILVMESAVKKQVLELNNGLDSTEFIDLFDKYIALKHILRQMERG